MRIKQIQMLKFEELSKRRQEKEIENHRSHFVEHEWWDFMLEDFVSEKAPEHGFDIDPSRIHFDLYGQGSYCVFETDEIDHEKLLEKFDPEAKHWPILHILKDDISIDIYNDDNYMRANYEEPYEPEEGEDDYEAYSIAAMQNESTMNDQLEEFVECILDEARSLATDLKNKLEDQYDYLQSDEHIIEELKMNEYEFEGEEVIEE